MHAASIVCVLENPEGAKKRMDFETYPMNPAGAVFQEAEVSKEFRFFDIHEGQKLPLLSKKLAQAYRELIMESDEEVSIKEFIDDLECNGIHVCVEDEVIHNTVYFYSNEECDPNSNRKYAYYTLYSDIIYINKSYERLANSFEGIRQGFLLYLENELAVIRKYAPLLDLHLEFEEMPKDSDNFIDEIQSAVSHFNLTI